MMVARDIYASSVSRAMHLLPGNNPIEDSRMKIIFVLNALLVKDERFQISFFFCQKYAKHKTAWRVWKQGCIYTAQVAAKNKAHKANDASSWWWNDCMMMWLHEIRLVYTDSYNYLIEYNDLP